MEINEIQNHEEELSNLNLVQFFTKKELCYYKMIDKFYKNCSKDKIVKMIDIIDGISNISLRILDWFVTKFSRRGIDIVINDETYDIHINYKAQLKSYKKRYFDPFRRKKRFNYVYVINNEVRILQTTIGQLNFFKWAINYDIINYVETNFHYITKAMNASNKELNNKKKLKKQELISKINSETDDTDDTDDTNNTDNMDKNSYDTEESDKTDSEKIIQQKSTYDKELILSFD